VVIEELRNDTIFGAIFKNPPQSAALAFPIEPFGFVHENVYFPTPDEPSVQMQVLRPLGRGGRSTVDSANIKSGN
jgi:hypothetical protein